MQASKIPTVPCEKHLGNLIGRNILGKVIEESTNKLYQNTNLLLSQFSHCGVDTRYKLFKSYCMAVYGSQLWDFASKVTERFYVAWRKCVRRLLKIPHNTHSRYLHIMCNDFPVDLQLHTRFVNFIKSCRNSKCDLVRLCCMLATKGSKSSVSNSWRHICTKWNTDNDVSIRELKMLSAANVCVEDNITAALIHDLLCLRDSTCDPDITELIHELCIS